MPALTVIQALPALTGGGVERGTLEIAAALVAGGHRAIVISGDGPMAAELEAMGAESWVFPVGRKSPLAPLRVGALARLIDTANADIVHARSRLPAWMCWWALKRLTRRPAFVTTLHGLNSVSRYSRIMTRGDRVIAVSESCRDYWLSHYPDLSPERTTVIHRGIDPGRYPHGYQPTPDWRDGFESEYAIPGGRRWLCLPGRLTRLKGHHAFLQLLARLRDEEPRVHGLLVGGTGRPAYRRELERLAAGLGIVERVSLTGHRDDLREIMAESDLVFSLSSRPEAFGRTVAEALALGRPVLGWQHGGVGEILDRIYPAGAVALGDEDGLLNATVELLRNPPLVPDEQPFRLDTMGRQTLNLYQSLAVAGG